MLSTNRVLKVVESTRNANASLQRTVVFPTVEVLFEDRRFAALRHSDYLWKFQVHTLLDISRNEQMNLGPYSRPRRIVVLSDEHSRALKRLHLFLSRTLFAHPNVYARRHGVQNKTILEKSRKYSICIYVFRISKNLVSSKNSIRDLLLFIQWRSYSLQSRDVQGQIIVYAI